MTLGFRAHTDVMLTLARTGTPMALAPNGVEREATSVLFEDGPPCGERKCNSTGTDRTTRVRLGSTGIFAGLFRMQWVT